MLNRLHRIDSRPVLGVYGRTGAVVQSQEYAYVQFVGGNVSVCDVRELGVSAE